MSTITALRFEKALETAVKSVLQAALPVGTTILTSEIDTQNISTNRIEVRADVTQWGPHEYDGKYDQAQMQLSVTCVSDPGDANSPVTQVGNVRAALTWSALNTALTEHHLVPDFRITATSRMADDDRNEIALMDTYTVGLFVKTTAWGA